MKRLRRHFSGKPAERLQNAVVSECRNDIIDLIEVYCVTLTDVATAVRAEGKPVVDDGLKTEMLNQIGTAIRSA